jgi:hypothetical protein
LKAYNLQLKSWPSRFSVEIGLQFARKKASGKLNPGTKSTAAAVAFPN